MSATSVPLPDGISQPSTYCSEVIQRRDESKKWLRMNVWDEWVEVWRAIKCKTKPIYKKDAAGRDTKQEDTSRTNVAMPDMNIIYRRNVARLSAEPYSLRVIGAGDPTVGPRMSAVLSQQYDRSKERSQDVRVRMAAEALGVGYSKIYWDYVVKQMTFRKGLMKGGEFAYRDRASLMQLQRAPDDEIQGAVSELGPDLSDQEVADFLAKSGNEINVPQEVPKYEGPAVKAVFPGDLYREPFAKTLQDSSFIIESYRESDIWLKKMLKIEYKDPDSGETMKAFDPDAVQKLMSLDPEPAALKGEYQELRDLFHTSIGKQDQLQYQFPRNLRVRKQYDILEEHTQDSDGRMWVSWVSEHYRDKPLGRMCYPWDLYGLSAYTEEVPLPDLIDAIGDSTPRLLRYLYQMHNMTVAQNFDYITNLLRKILFVKTGIEFDTDVVERGMFRTIGVSDMNGWKYLEDPPLPNGALERESQILQMMSLAEPALSSLGGDSPTNPLAGKTATQSVLASKSSDVLLQFKMEGRNAYLWELGMKKLWMNQQAAQDAWSVQSKYFGKDLRSMANPGEGEKPPEWATSDRMGKTVAIKLDPMEIQEDLEVEPEAGSYMAVDDELKRQSAMDLDQVAMQVPQIVNVRKVVQFHLSTIRGLGNTDEYMMPETPPGPPPPKVNFNIGLTGKMEDQPELTKAVLGQYGITTPDELDEQAQANTLGRVSKAADHATNLLSPAQPPEEESTLSYAESK